MKTKARTPSASSSKTSAAPNQPPNHALIAAKAEALWRQRGRPIGADLEIWLDAERQLKLAGRCWRMKRDMKALSNPIPRLNLRRGGVVGELEDLFPRDTGRSTTSL